MTLPIIGITMGDPAGVGPEVIVGAYNAGLSNLECHPIVIGNADRLRDAARIMGHDVQINTCMSVDDAVFDNAKTINCIDAATVPSDFPYGKNTQLGGEVAFQCVKRATKMAVKNEIQAICTAPLSKEAIHMAGHMYPGHTEMIADLTNTKEVSMMLTAPNLRVIHITTHIGLIDAINKIEPGLVFRTIERGHTALVQMLGREPLWCLRNQPPCRRRRAFWQW
jgi:4-hydroxy-L-threonine phosphate dehydrogenase PdxA